MPFSEKEYYMFTGVVSNLHGHEGKEKGHFLVNSGTVYFQQMVNFVMEERSFSRKCAVG
jgi:hypothetical protein